MHNIIEILFDFCLEKMIFSCSCHVNMPLERTKNCWHLYCFSLLIVIQYITEYYPYLCILAVLSVNFDSMVISQWLNQAMNGIKVNCENRTECITFKPMKNNGFRRDKVVLTFDNHWLPWVLW